MAMIKQIVVWGLVVAFGLLWFTRRAANKKRRPNR
jgi:hypothetical protein